MLPPTRPLLLALLGVGVAFLAVPARAQHCPGQPEVALDPVSHNGFHLEEGYLCGSLEQPQVMDGGLINWPVFPPLSPGFGQACPPRTARYVVSTNSGCVMGASAGMSGRVVIPPQGGRFEASILLSVQFQDLRCTHGYWATNGLVSVVITEPGEHDWVLYVPAMPGPEYGGAGRLRVEKMVYLCLDVEPGGAGTVETFSLTSRPVVSCSQDFDGDGDIGTDADIEAFFACLSGQCCPGCPDLGADYNGDGDIGTDADIESFFRVLSGGPC